MPNEEVLKERERIKKLVERVINATIKWREENVKSNKRLTSVFNRIKSHLLFLIDNPDYKRTGNIKQPDEYNTWRNLEKGNIKFTPPKEIDFDKPIELNSTEKIEYEYEDLDDEEEDIEALEKSLLKEHKELSIKEREGFSKDTPIRFSNSESEEDDEEEDID